MPGSSSPGRSAPVRGGTPSPPTTHQSPVRSVPYSSGLPAPAIAVPIFRAQTQLGARSSDFPDSPPDTPPLSPLRTSATLPAHMRRDHNNAFVTNNSTPTLDLLTQAASNLLLQPRGAKPRRRSAPSQPVMSTSATNAASSSAIELMPATPEISPDNDVRHYAQKSARAFLQRIFDDVSDNVAIEDAGIELVCRGWTGAVIKMGSGQEHVTSTSIQSNASSSASSSDSRRTLYVSMPTLVDSSLLREQVLSILDAASEKLGCENVMICLERHMRDFSSVLHGLCYVGGQVIAASQIQNKQLGEERSTLSNIDPVSGLALRSHLVLVAIELV